MSNLRGSPWLNWEIERQDSGGTGRRGRHVATFVHNQRQWRNHHHPEIRQKVLSSPQAESPNGRRVRNRRHGVASRNVCRLLAQRWEGVRGPSEARSAVVFVMPGSQKGRRRSSVANRSR